MTHIYRSFSRESPVEIALAAACRLRDARDKKRPAAAAAA